MTIEPHISFSVEDAALAVLALLAALESDGQENLSAFLPLCPQIDANRAALIVPLISDMASASDGVEAVLDLIAEALPHDLTDTVYLLGAEYVSTYGTALPEQMRLLERLSETIKLDRLTRAALDRAALARSRDLKKETAQ